MNVQTHPRTTRTWPVAIAAAALATGLTATVFVFAVGTGSEQAAPSVPATPRAVTAPATPQAAHGVDVMALTPARLAAGALGLGYALPTVPLPSVQQGPTTASILASMSPQTRAYPKAIMSLTFAQLAAGAGGQP
jgi:hypothetical protein